MRPLEYVKHFPHKVQEVEPVSITMPDGTRLAARLWLPEGAEHTPVPAILEYLPYRKRDSTARRDSLNHRYFAGHGYACVRVDLRGSGDSEGVLEDEYLEQELADGEAVLRWIAAQPWCDGAIGMMGISWGGFNGLQIAARRPPELKAIITLCSTDDRYSDDVHYMGGCLLGDNLSWASTMFAYNSLPPDPEIVGERWREMWFERLAGSGLWLDTWLRHQHRDAYWQHGSVAEDLTAIACPVFAVSGWADGYTNAVFRLLEGLNVPRLGLIGPWSHRYPHLGLPGPAIGFLQEALRWWDRWLRDQENAIMDEPMLRIWKQDTVSPFTSYDHRPGRWVGEPQWPSERVAPRRYRLSPRSLVAPEEPLPQTVHDPDLAVNSPLSVGLFAGKWCSYAGGPDLPGDQREEDGGALVFDSSPLSEDVEVLGVAVAELELSVDRPVAMVAVRLSEVLAHGPATRITYGLLNLAHRDSHEHPEPLEPHRRYRVSVPLNAVAQRFCAGSRLRLAVSTSYWPIAWLPPASVTLTVHTEASGLILPVRSVAEPDPVPTFEPPEAAEPRHETQLEPIHQDWLVKRHLDADVSTLEVIEDKGTRRIDDIDLEITTSAVECYTYRADDVTSARGETRWHRGLRRGDWDVKTRTRTVLTCTETHFHIEAELDAFEGERRVFSRNWHRVVPRRLV